MFPTADQVSETTHAADANLSRYKFKAVWKMSFQNCVVEDVKSGRYTKEQAINYLKSRGCYGKRGNQLMGEL